MALIENARRATGHIRFPGADTEIWAMSCETLDGSQYAHTLFPFGGPLPFVWIGARAQLPRREGVVWFVVERGCDGAPNMP